MTQQVKDLELSLLWLWLLLWRGFDPWLGNFHMLRTQKKKKLLNLGLGYKPDDPQGPLGTLLPLFTPNDCPVITVDRPRNNWALPQRGGVFRQELESVPME